MFGYALGFVPLTLQLNAEFLEVGQPWYTDDASATADFKCIQQMFECLK
jgi:hypothetical protein